VAPVDRSSFRRAAQVSLIVAFSLLIAGPANSAYENRAPVASYTFSPSAPLVGEQVSFSSTSTDSDGRIAYQAWDLDNDGSFDDGTAVTASRSFASAGTYTVRLAAVDDDWAYTVSSKTITVKANTPPMAAFSASTLEPETGQTVSLTSSSSDPDGRPLVEAWDLDNDGAFDDKTGGQATVSFPDNGVRRVSLRVTDSLGVARSATRDITVRNRPPQPAIGVSAADVQTGTPIDFTSQSTDPDGAIRSWSWDFTGDGVADATGSTARRSFADDGTFAVTLTVTDDDGAARSASRQIVVRNRAPSASFEFGPAQPLTGDEIVLRSRATDLDGRVAEHRWDLDNDGAFDDATGAEVRTSFATAGSHMVALQARDDDGAASAPAFQSIDVTRRPDPPRPADPPVDDPGPAEPRSGTPGTEVPGSLTTTGPPSAGSGTPRRRPRPRLLDPFPSVRIHGVTTPTGARLDLLGVRTTGGTRIVVRCKGKGCPWERWTQSARFSATRLRMIRVPGLSSRHLGAGTVIELFVIHKSRIGKYTRFRVRRLKPPTRLDRCTAPDAARVRKCGGR
jgi:PKD repeat protein